VKNAAPFYAATHTLCALSASAAFSPRICWVVLRCRRTRAALFSYRTRVRASRFCIVLIAHTHATAHSLSPRASAVCAHSRATRDRHRLCAATRRQRAPYITSRAHIGFAHAAAQRRCRRAAQPIARNSAASHFLCAQMGLALLHAALCTGARANSHVEDIVINGRHCACAYLRCTRVARFRYRDMTRATCAAGEHRYKLQATTSIAFNAINQRHATMNWWAFFFFSQPVRRFAFS